jgi:hypothetical protein
MLLSEILDNKRELLQKIILHSKNKKQISQNVDVDVLRIIMMSLSVFPFLIKGVLEQSDKTSVNNNLMEKVAKLAGGMLQEYIKPDHDPMWVSLK